MAEHLLWVEYESVCQFGMGASVQEQAIVGFLVWVISFPIIRSTWPQMLCDDLCQIIEQINRLASPICRVMCSITANLAKGFLYSPCLWLRAILDALV